MGIHHTAQLTPSDIIIANAGARAKGPLSVTESRPLGEYIGVQEKTVREWFQEKGRAGCLRRDYEGRRIAQMPEPAPKPKLPENPSPTDETAYQIAFAAFNAGAPRKRAFLGVCFGAPGGLIRERLINYMGGDYEEITKAPNLAFCLQIIHNVYTGKLDHNPGFRLSKAWYEITIQPRAPRETDDRPYPWQVVVKYGGFTPFGDDEGEIPEEEGESDPKEPFFEPWPDEVPEEETEPEPMPGTDQEALDFEE